MKPTNDQLAQVLDTWLERDPTAAHADAAVPGAAPELAEALAPLAELADALRALPALPGPGAAFRAELRARLAAAPAPGQAAAGKGAASSIPTAGEPATAADATFADAAAIGPTGPFALAQALDLLLERGDEADARLEGDPALAGELEPLLGLAEQLQALPAAPSPGAEFRARLAAELREAPEPRSLAPRPQVVQAGLARRLWRSTAFMAAAAATFVLFLGSGATYASANALPGDWLYPVKRAAELARAWLVPGDDIGLHLQLADRRLDEALSAQPYAGAMLADFSREVTAALVLADGRLALGTPRAQIADPLMAWLLGARGRLVGGRPELPPIAWRASLALVDEAILALRSDQPLSLSPVPRLWPAGTRLASAAPAAVAIPRRAPVEHREAAALPADPGQRRAVEQAGRARRAAAGPAAPAIPPPGDAPAAAAPALAAQAPAIPAQAAEPAEPADPAGSAKEPDEPGGSSRDIPPPTPTEAPPPTATEAPPIPSATEAPPTAPPATPTLVADLPPVIDRVSCSPQKLQAYDPASCKVVASDPEGGSLVFTWYVSPLHGELSDPDQAETRLLVYRPGSGYEPLPLVIKVTVADAGGQQVVGETTVTVVPYLEGGGG